MTCVVPAYLGSGKKIRPHTPSGQNPSCATLVVGSGYFPVAGDVAAGLKVVDDELDRGEEEIPCILLG